MNNLQHLESIRVADAMTVNVIDVEANQSMCTAAACLRQHGLAAAPVVDEQGHCIGMLTGTDFLKRECHHNERCDGAAGPQEFELVKGDAAEALTIEAYSEDRVRHHMTVAVQSISPEATLHQAALMMQRSHLHHLVVLDEHERPTGILSTIDIISALLNASGGEHERT